MRIKKAMLGVFSRETVKHITDFDATHLKGGGFQENIPSMANIFNVLRSVFARLPP